MVQLAFLLVIIFGGVAVVAPIVGLTLYLLLRPWVNAYTARQHALAAHHTATVVRIPQVHPDTTHYQVQNPPDPMVVGDA